ncbi:MAG: DUF1641 domain-containing protein [Planctomycetia bacterium]|nr:MAG: DUF1641 domain-containing protein [Planctomycetia bacterium]TVL96156.1 MAG: hypothetical protein CV082_07900 [Candidatus Brocadia sp. BL1]HQU31020.1 DUF1641 domain-containing protein [Candidatus Brocadia sapporoensis]
MEYDKTKEPASQESPNISEITELLTRLFRRIDSLERSFANFEDIVKKLPVMMAITTDSIDEYYSNAVKSGIDIEERCKRAVEMLIQITDPKRIDTLSQLIKNIDTLTLLLNQVGRIPDTLAVIVDSFDELCKNAECSGIDFDQIVKQGKDAAALLNGFLKSDELKALMNSGILNPKTINIVAQAGCALAECKEDRPGKLGIIGLIKALGNCDLQCALGFLVNFGKRFGRLLKDNES